MGSLLGKREKLLFDSRNLEVLRLAGAEPITLWHFVKYPKVGSVSGFVDCLYGEPLPDTKHYLPYKVLGWFEQPSQLIEGMDEGYQNTDDFIVYFSRKDLENKKVPINPVSFEHISVGDIIQIFKGGIEFYLEVRNVEKDGWINDSDVWTQYRCDTIQNSSFSPALKLEGSR